MKRKTQGGLGPWRWEFFDGADPSVGIFRDTYTIYREGDEEQHDGDYLLVSTEIEAEIICQKLNEAQPLIDFMLDNDREYCFEPEPHNDS